MTDSGFWTYVRPWLDSIDRLISHPLLSQVLGALIVALILRILSRPSDQPSADRVDGSAGAPSAGRRDSPATSGRPVFGLDRSLAAVAVLVLLLLGGWHFMTRAIRPGEHAARSVPSNPAPAVQVPSKPVRHAFEGKLMYGGYPPDGGTGLFLLGPDGESRLYSRIGKYGSGFLTPDGNQLLFCEGTEIQILPLTGGAPVAKFTRAGSCYSLSPDGRRIVYASLDGGNNEIHIMNADGSDDRRLTTCATDDSYPTLSARGDIVFDSNRTGQYQIWIMRDDGSNVRRLTANTTPEYHPHISPDGSKVAYSTDSYTLINIVDIDGGKHVALDQARGIVIPCFSPDGKFVAGRRERDILIVPATGGPPVAKIPARPGLWGDTLFISWGLGEPTESGID